MDGGSLGDGLREARGAVRDYCNARLALWKLEAVEALARMGSALLLGVCLVMGMGFLLLFVGVALALWMGGAMGSYALGFLVVAGGWLGLLIAIYGLRRALFTSPLVRQLYAYFFRPKGGDDATA